MSSEESPRTPNLFRIVGVIMVVSILIFMGAAVAAVYTGEKQDQAICDAINGLRTDLVETVRGGEARSQAAIEEAFDGAQEEALLRNLAEQTQETINKIEDPECP